MPISKEDALANAEDRDTPLFNQLCEVIDKAITDIVGTRRVIAVDIANTPRHIVDRAVETYRALGWEAKVTYDQRDGDYLTLT